jgi:hypothetical protein
MEVLHVMPETFLATHTALEIAEIQAYYQLKYEDDQIKKQQEDLERQDREARERKGGGRRR